MDIKAKKALGTLDILHSAKPATTVAFRLFEIYSRMLHYDESARHALEGYLERIPNAEQRSSAEKRLGGSPVDDPLQAPSAPLQFERD